MFLFFFLNIVENPLLLIHFLQWRVVTMTIPKTLRKGSEGRSPGCISRACSAKALFLLLVIWCYSMYFQNIEDDNTRKKIQKSSSWPGVPKEKLGCPLVVKGNNFLPFLKSIFEVKNLAMLEEFLSLYENRPDKVNLCGIRINHALALFATIKHLKPTAIIESGVNAGLSTYIMRGAAGPNTKIFAIDPLEMPICEQKSRWIDSNSNTEYFTGDKFKDFTDIDWNTLISDKNIDPSQVLVYFDDHLNVYNRFPTLMKNGFRHVLLEDNYRAGEGTTNCNLVFPF